MDINELMASLERSLKPYQEDFVTYKQFPKEGRSRQEIIDEMKLFYTKEEPKWKEGFISGTVYHGDQEHIDFQNEVYAINSQSNPMHFDTWPSTVKYEAEIVSMTANRGPTATWSKHN